jgi:hypothetical protein
MGVAKHLIIACTDQMPESKIPVYVRPQVLEWLSAKAIPPLLSQNWASTQYSDSMFGDLKNFGF